MSVTIAAAKTNRFLFIVPSHKRLGLPEIPSGLFAQEF